MGENRSFAARPIRIPIVFILAFGTVACGEKSFPPLASVPFDASKAGNSVTIPVTVTSGNANLDHIYMVGLYMRDGGTSGPAEQMRVDPPRARLDLRVRIFHEAEMRDEPVAIDDGAFEYDMRTKTFLFLPSMRERRTDIAHVSSSGKLKDVAYMKVVSFRFPDYGRYRVEVATVSDMPIFKSVPVTLTVERQFPHGK